jgi:O-antigen/teichoic acid export membrane protein
MSTVPPRVRADQNIVTVAKGGGIVFTGNLFESGARFAIGVVLARLLGAEQLGLCNLALSVASIAAGLALLGLPSAMVRYISLFLGRRDTAGVWGALQVGLGLTTILSVSMGIGLFVLADPIAERVFHESRLVPLLRVMSLVVPFLALSSIVAAATRGFKKMQYTVIGQNIAQPAIRLLLVVALAIVVGLNAKRALVAFGAAVMIVFVMLLYFLNSLFPLKRPLGTARRSVKEVLRFSLPLYLSGLIGIFGGNIKTMLLGALNTATSVGIFAVASQINTVGKMFHHGIVTAAAPIVSDLYDRGEREQLGHFYQTVTKWTLTLNLPLFLAVLLFPVPILSIFGQGFVGGGTALTILAWTNLVNTGTGICGTVLDMTGNTSLKLVNSLVTFALAIGLNILLIPRWGLMGAATASLAGAVTVNLLRLLEVFILFRLLPYNSSCAKPVVAGLVALAAAWGMRQLLPIQTDLFFLAMNVILIFAVHAGVILLLGLSQEDRAVLARVGRHMRAVFSK